MGSVSGGISFFVKRGTGCPGLWICGLGSRGICIALERTGSRRSSGELELGVGVGVGSGMHGRSCQLQQSRVEEAKEVREEQFQDRIFIKASTQGSDVTTCVCFPMDRRGLNYY